MATIDITFETVNTSLQIGDVLFYVSIQDDGNFKKNSNDATKLGLLRSISIEDDGDVKLTVDIADNVATPSGSSYFFFSKNVAANYSGLTGYYAEVKMSNSKTSKAELFSIGSEVVESSK